jgi:hypothetical protein
MGRLDYTCTAVSQVTDAVLGFLVSMPISPIILPRVKKSIRLHARSPCFSEPLQSLVRLNDSN